MGEKLTPLQVHEIICFEGDAVLSGGIRRASCISLFNFDDEEMLTCKYGNWWEENPQRGRANNSAVVMRHAITEEEFFKRYDNLIPERVKMMVEKRDQPIFTWETHYHFNYS